MLHTEATQLEFQDHAGTEILQLHMYLLSLGSLEAATPAHIGNVQQDSSSACGNQDRRSGASAAEGNGFNSSCQQCVAERAAAVAAEAVTVSSVSTSTSTEAAATPNNRRNANSGSSSSVVLQGGTLERERARQQQQQQPQSGGGGGRGGMVFSDVPLKNVFQQVEENR